MKEQKYPLVDSERLRQKAEDLLKKQPVKTISQFSESDLSNYFHEMEVRQIMLELQNDELRHAWAVSEVSNLKYTELYDFAPIGYFTLSKNGKIVELNFCGSRMLGKERGQLENSNFNSFVSQDTLPIFNHFLGKVFNSKIKESCDVTLVTNDRLPIFVSLSAIAMKNEEQCHLIAVDITERKQADELLEQTRRNYEIFFNTIEDFLFVLDADGNIIHCNSTVINRLGYTREELFGQSVLMIHPPERRDEASRIVGEMLTGVTEFCPVPIATKSGVQIPVETRVNHGFWDNKPAIFGVTKDISKLKLSEEKFSKLFHINPSACGLSDLDNQQYIEVNEAFYTLFGFNNNEVIGKTATEIGLITDKTINDILSQADENGNVTNISADLKAKNGDIKHVLLSSENIYIHDKKYRYTVVHDITARKKAEDALRTSEDKFRSLIHYSGDPIFSFNPDETYQFVNQSFAKVFGLTPDDLLGKSPHFIFPFEEAERRLTMVRKVLQTGQKDEIEVKVVAQSGEVLYFLTTLDPIKNEQGKILFVTCISKEITERKRSEIALRQSEEKFRLIAENTSDTIMLLDMDFNVTYINPSIEKISGYTSEEAILLKMEKMLTPDSLKKMRELFASYLPGGISENSGATTYPSIELEAYHKNGTLVWGELSFSLLQDKNNIPTGIVTVLRDITARKKSQAELLNQL